MVKQYPHTATVTITGTPVTQPNGDITPGETTTSSFICRLEPASGNGYVTGIGGIKVDYQWKLYCNKSTAVIPVGASIVVTNNVGEQLCKDTVKFFSKGQLNCRLWL